MFRGDSGSLEPSNQDDLSLSAYLDGLVARLGCRGTAAELGVAYSTVSRWQNSGALTKALRTALEYRIVLEAGVPRDEQDAELEALTDALGKLQQTVDGLSEQDRQVDEALSAVGTRLERLEGDLKLTRAQVRELQSAAQRQDIPHDPEKGLGRRGGLVPGRVATTDSGSDESALLEQWNVANSAVETAHAKLDLMRARRDLLELEIAILERPGMSVPPGEHWDHFRRRQALEWRWSALRDSRREIARRTLFIRLRRLVSLGLWRI